MEALRKCELMSELLQSVLQAHGGIDRWNIGVSKQGNRLKQTKENYEKSKHKNINRIGARSIR